MKSAWPTDGGSERCARQLACVGQMGDSSVFRSWAQAGQDDWVLGLVDGPGVFVDVGAYDGVEHSNTLALEEAGWRGLCIEPNPVAFERLRANRRCTCAMVACAAADGTVPFDGFQIAAGGPPVEARTLDRVTAQASLPWWIDFLSLDVEGYELEVLAGSTAARFRLVTVEHNLYRDGPEHKDAIFKYLTARGFERAVEDVVADGYGPYEDWFTNEAWRAW